MSKPNDDEEMYVTLDLEDGEVECLIEAIFECGGKDYIALLPLDENGENEDGEVWIYGHSEDADGTPHLRYIDDEDEYERASDAFDEYLDSIEFDELIDEEDEVRIFAGLGNDALEPFLKVSSVFGAGNDRRDVQ